MSHYEERLERDLTNVRKQVAEMAVLVETATRNAMHALQTGNHKLASGGSTGYVINSLPCTCRLPGIFGCCPP
jgi:hypothetical protein